MLTLLAAAFLTNDSGVNRVADGDSMFSHTLHKQMSRFFQPRSTLTRLDKALGKVAKQGDQIGRIFASGAIVYFGQLF
jgi:hypothetical protein